jgi:predicted RNA-binding protein with RPS1 domain
LLALLLQIDRQVAVKRQHAETHIFLHHADDAFIHHAHDFYMRGDDVDVKLIDARTDGKQDFEIAVAADIIRHSPGDEVSNRIRIDAGGIHRKGQFRQVAGQGLPENLAALRVGIEEESHLKSVVPKV